MAGLPAEMRSGGGEPGETDAGVVDNGFPLHIPLAGECGETTGFVLCEQSRVFDLEARNAAYKDHVSDALLLRVKNVLRALLD